MRFKTFSIIANHWKGLEFRTQVLIRTELECYNKAGQYLCCDRQVLVFSVCGQGHVILFFTHDCPIQWAARRLRRSWSLCFEMGFICDCWSAFCACSQRHHASINQFLFPVYNYPPIFMTSTLLLLSPQTTKQLLLNVMCLLKEKCHKHKRITWIIHRRSPACSMVYVKSGENQCTSIKMFRGDTKSDRSGKREVVD